MTGYEEHVTGQLRYLTETGDFYEIACGEAQVRGLVIEDIVDRVNSIYYDLCPPGCRHKETHVIRDTDFTAKERAAIISFMKVQRHWYDTVSWREDVSGKADKGNLQGY